MNEKDLLSLLRLIMKIYRITVIIANALAIALKIVKEGLI
jgi:hypothetical protein